MIKPERMSKLFIVGPKSTLSNVVSTLHKLKAAHFIEHKKDEYDLCSPLEQLEKTSSLLVQTRSMITHLNISGEVKETKELKLDDLEKGLTDIKENVNKHVENIKSKEDELSIISEQKKILKLLTMLDLSPSIFQNSGYINSYLGYVSDADIKEKISSITENFEIFTMQEDKKTFVALFVEAAKSEEAEVELSNANFSEIDTNSVISLKGPAKECFEGLIKNEGKMGKEIQAGKNTLKELAKKHKSYLLGTENFLSTETDKAQAPLSFGSTKETFFMSAFVPKKDIQSIRKQLQDSASGNLYFEEQKLGDAEEIPIKLNNKGYTKQFEFFTNIYSLPKYDEFDPTSLMAYTFPIFMGFMLGDVAYGIIIAALFYYLKKKFPVGSNFFNIMISAGISTMIFGILFGEVLGFEPWHGLIVRTHDFDMLMAIAVITGVVHVNFGLLLGFILEFKNHGIWQAITHKMSWVLIQIGALLFIGPLMGLVSFPELHSEIGMWVLLVGIFLLYKAEGFIGIIELPTIISHILSYARLMAVGLASVFIAVMVNQFATFLFHKGILFIPLALIALIIGQTFALALGILSPSLHSVRLHYVEFFTKFYSGGGKEFSAFGAEKEKSIL
ncbi:V-type ATP synthase subunit I [Candidatus Woesearchaeota archaeon]|nr:V-type ATP synthase subunit I [Candidatus Woesearchaeota archaeon]